MKYEIFIPHSRNFTFSCHVHCRHRRAQTQWDNTDNMCRYCRTLNKIIVNVHRNTHLPTSSSSCIVATATDVEVGNFCTHTHSQHSCCDVCVSVTSENDSLSIALKFNWMQIKMLARNKRMANCSHCSSLDFRNEARKVRAYSMLGMSNTHAWKCTIRTLTLIIAFVCL